MMVFSPLQGELIFRAPGARAYSAARDAAAGQKGYSLSEENTPFENPRERRGESPLDPRIGSRALEELHTLRDRLPAVFLLLYDLTFFYPPLLLSNLVGSLSSHRLLRILSVLQLPAEAALLRSPRWALSKIIALSIEEN